MCAMHHMFPGPYDTRTDKEEADLTSNGNVVIICDLIYWNTRNDLRKHLFLLLLPIPSFLASKYACGIF